MTFVSLYKTIDEKKKENTSFSKVFYIAHIRNKLVMSLEFKSFRLRVCLLNLLSEVSTLPGLVVISFVKVQREISQFLK